MTTDDEKESDTYEGDDLREAKAWLRRRFKAGLMSACPCCAQTVKRYARSISPAMLKALRALADAGGVGLATTDLVKLSGNGDYAKLTGWSLIEKTSDGRWLATDKGRRFLSGYAEIPKYTYWYNGCVVGVSEETTTIFKVKKTEAFDLEEVLDPETGTPTADTKVAP